MYALATFKLGVSPSNHCPLSEINSIEKKWSFLGHKKKGGYQETITTAYPVKHGKTNKIHGIQFIEIFKKKHVFCWATGYSLSIW